MKRLNFAAADLVNLEETGTTVKALSKSKSEELAALIGTEIVEYTGEGTISINALDCLKSKITALKLDDNTSFAFVQQTSSQYIFVLLNENFDKINQCNFHNTSNLWQINGVKASDKCFLFRPVNMQRYECAVAVTYARTNDGSEIPVLVNRPVDSPNITCYCAIGVESFATGTTSQAYNTLISLQKCIWPSLQLICDYVYAPTHCGYDSSPKRFMLNGEKWITVGQTYSSSYYMYQLCAKILN